MIPQPEIFDLTKLLLEAALEDDLKQQDFFYLHRSTRTNYHGCKVSVKGDIRNYYKKKGTYKCVSIHFRDNIIALITGPVKELLRDFYELIECDNSFEDEAEKNRLLALASPEGLTTKRLVEFLSRTFIYAVQQENKAGKYETQCANASASTPVCALNLPIRNQFFTGRQEVLADLHTAFFEQGVPIQVITGMGGVGKTQTAWQYAHLHEDEYTDAIWLIRTESSLVGDIKDLLVRFNKITESVNDEKHIQNAIKDWGQQYHSWLLIFDNAESYDELEPYLPRMAKGHVIITTRNNAAFDDEIKQFSLDVFKKKEALVFLNSHGIPLDDYAEVLNQYLGGLPLALAQAAAYIKHQSDRSCKIYIEQLKKHGLQLLAKGKQPNYKYVVTTTWQVTFEKLSKAAQALMCLCAFLSPDRIPINMFVDSKECLPETLATQFSDDLNRNEIVSELTRYSLLSSVDRGVYSMHGLLKAVILGNIIDTTDYLKIAIDVVYRILFVVLGTKSKSELVKFKMYFHSCFFIAVHALYSMVSFAERGDSAFEAIVRIFDQLGTLCYINGMYMDALSMYENAESVCERSLADNKLARIFSIRIANGYLNIERYEDAIDTYNKALHFLEGSEEPDVGLLTLWINGQIAYTYAQTGEIDKALGIYMELVEKINTGGDENIHPYIALVLRNYGEYLDQLGRYSDALAVYDCALSILERIVCENRVMSFDMSDVLGHEFCAKSDNEDTAINIFTCIGYIYNRIGEYRAAYAAYKRTVDLCEKVLGEHPETAHSYKQLTTLLVHMGRYDEARLSCERAYQIQESILGRNHLDTLSTLHDIAIMKYRYKDFKIAEKMLNEVYDGYKEVFKMEKPEGKHMEAILACISLGDLKKEKGEIPAARDDLLRACDCCMRLLGINHAYTGMAFCSLGEVLEKMGEMDNALSRYVVAYASKTMRGECIEAQALKKHMEDVYHLLNGPEADFDSWMTEQFIQLKLLKEGARLIFPDEE